MNDAGHRFFAQFIRAILGYGFTVLVVALTFVNGRSTEGSIFKRAVSQPHAGLQALLGLVSGGLCIWLLARSALRDKRWRMWVMMGIYLTVVSMLLTLLHKPPILDDELTVRIIRSLPFVWSLILIGSLGYGIWYAIAYENKPFHRRQMDTGCVIPRDP